MGELDNNLLQFFYNGKPIRQGDFGCGTITKPSPTHAERMASFKSEVDAMAEKYQPIVDELMREIYDSPQKPIAFTTRKARKHYKPKFTL